MSRRPPQKGFEVQLSTGELNDLRRCNSDGLAERHWRCKQQNGSEQSHRASLAHAFFQSEFPAFVDSVYCVVVPLPEKAFISEIRRLATRQGHHKRFVQTGIGDDCAVLRADPASEILVTTDFTLEGVHFRRDWHPPESVGHRCLARGLSDIAAMGGTPVAVFLSLALPSDLPQSWVRSFLRGLTKLGTRHGVTLAGGDTAQSPGGILADIIVVGSTPKGKAIRRSRARPGDLIFVSGELGGSAAAVLRMEQKPARKVDPRNYRRHFYPEPRIELGRVLRRKQLAAAMIDTSDGLSTDLAHICEESRVGAEIDAAAIRRARVGKPSREVDLDLALHGGEDYELLFTARPGVRIPNQIAGVTLTQIGRITRKRTMLLRFPEGRSQRLKPRGWEHFRS
jgi:thiamine-monophosphate kinase